MLVVLSATLMLVDLFVAVMKVTVSVAIMQLVSGFCNTYDGSSENFCIKYVRDNFY